MTGFAVKNKGGFRVCVEVPASSLIRGAHASIHFIDHLLLSLPLPSILDQGEAGRPVGLMQAGYVLKSLQTASLVMLHFPRETFIGTCTLMTAKNHYPVANVGQGVFMTPKEWP